MELFSGVNIGHLYIGGAAVWLMIFVLLDLKTIVQGKRVTDVKSGGEEEYPLKNLFSVFMVGYITMEMTSVEPELLVDSSYFYLCFGVITLCSSHIIGTLYTIKAICYYLTVTAKNTNKSRFPSSLWSEWWSFTTSLVHFCSAERISNPS